MITDEQLAEALAKNGGVYQLAAEALGCSRQNVGQRVRANEELLKIAQGAKERVSDIAEAVIIEAIGKRKDMKACMWWLERKAKERGFSARTELTGPRGGPVQLAMNAQDFSGFLEGLTRDQREQFIRLYRGHGGGGGPVGEGEPGGGGPDTPTPE